MRARIEAVAWRLGVGAIYLFLFAPLLVIVLTSINPNGLALPVTGVTDKWYAQMAGDTRLQRAFLLSVWIALVATAVTLPIVVTAAVALRDARIPGHEAIESFFLSPLIVPQVVVGFALLVYFNAADLVGSWPGIALAHVVVTIPYALRTVLAAFKNFDRRLEEAARNLGATPLEAVRYVTLPLLKPALIAAAGFAFVMSFTNFTITIFLVGPGTVTLPIRIYQYITFYIDPTISAIATVLSGISLLVVLVIDRTVGVQELSGF